MLLTAAAASLLQVQTPSAQEPPRARGPEIAPPHIVHRTSPDWLSRPSADDVAAVYPRRAAFDGVSGRAVMQCDVLANGRLERCNVVEEYPPGAGFGAACLRLAGRFKMRPKTRDGSPVAGGQMTIPVSFFAPRPTPPAHAASRIDWLSRPSGADLYDVYPRRSELDHVGGEAAMKCGVIADGHLAGCVVVEEDPPGYGFGKAALKLAPKFRMSPTTSNGTSVAGASVTIPMRFTPPSRN